MHDSLQIEEIAANWLSRRDGECWSVADQVELTVWLEAATAHRVAYIRLEAAWRQARRLKALMPSVPNRPSNDPPRMLTVVTGFGK